MSTLEKRDRLGRPAKDESWGECFIAIREGDEVRTISGIADSLDIEHDPVWSTGIQLHCEHQVSIHFVGTVVEELRPFDGKVVPT